MRPNAERHSLLLFFGPVRVQPGGPMWIDADGGGEASWEASPAPAFALGFKA